MTYIDSNKFSIKVNRNDTPVELGENGRVQSTVYVYKGDVQLIPVETIPNENQFRVTISSTENCSASIKNLNTIYVNYIMANADEGSITLDINVEGKTNFIKRIKLIKSVTRESVSNIEKRVNIAEQRITDDAITNMVKKGFYTKGETNTKMSLVEQTVDSWGVRIVENEKTLTELKLTNEEFEVSIGNKADRSNIISMINASTEGITISSSKVNITGYVTFSDLSTAGRTSISGGNITSGTIRGIRIISSTSDTVARGELSGNGLSFYSPTKLAGTIYFDSNGEGTPSSAKDRFLIQSKNDYVLKLLSSGDMSITSSDMIFFEANEIQTNCDLDLDGKQLYSGNIYNSRNVTTETLTVNAGATVGSTLTIGGTTTINNNLYVEGMLYGWGSTELGNASKWTPVGTASRDYLRLGSALVMGDSSNGLLVTNTSGNWLNIRVGTVYANGTALSSDKRLKTDIKYVNVDNQEIGKDGLMSPNVNITTSDMHEFVETLPMVSYRLIEELNNNRDDTHYGFLAQEIMYTKVGSELIEVPRDEYGNEIDGYLRYSENKFIAFICGALQEEIKRSKELEKRVEELENKLKQ